MVWFDTGTLRIMMLILIIYGYFYMLVALGIIILFPCVLLIIKSKSEEEIIESEVHEPEEYLTNIPGGELLLSYRNRRRTAVMLRVSGSLLSTSRNATTQSLVHFDDS